MDLQNLSLKGRGLLLIIFLVLFSISAQGQNQNIYADKGIFEIGGSVSYQRFTPVISGKTGETVTTFFASPYVGYFLFRGFEIGINPAEVVIISQLGRETTQALFFIAPSYHVQWKKNIFPFVEAKLGFAYKTRNGQNEKGLSWGGRAGLKMALVDNGLLNLSIRYLQITLNPEGVSKRNGFNEWMFSVGWTVWF